MSADDIRLRANASSARAMANTHDLEQGVHHTGQLNRAENEQKLEYNRMMLQAYQDEHERTSKTERTERESQLQIKSSEDHFKLHEIPLH